MSDDFNMPRASRPEWWRFFAAEAGKDGDCPLYQLLANRIAEDDEIKAVAGAAQEGQPPANILFAAVHFLLLGGAAHELRLYYPHLVKPDEMVRAADDAAFAVFKDFVRRHRREIEALARRRVTNTNEVRRCSYLRCGYAEIARRADAPLHLIELGPSAGLNLNWDRYAYRYEGAETLSGGGASTLTIDAAWRGETPPPVPAAHPAMPARIGLERSPVDLSNEEDRRWLVALIWPGRPDRIRRQQAALAIARDHMPPVRAGDALESLPAAIGEADAGLALTVAHTMVLYQWPQPARAALDALLREASQRRPIYRLYQDTLSLDDITAGRTPLRLTTYWRGGAETEVLADAHHHGSWIAWGPQPAG